ncbi:MAG: hypothetical protein JW789_00405 [Candidatus Aenigmarchaeota archaeon]|nr:hypothetical protein [Candidatus Aenigmarchaeota archaeon]
MLYDNDFITAEKQEEMAVERRDFYRSKGIILDIKRGIVPMKNLIATQAFVEGDKFREIYRRALEEGYNVPILVEDHPDLMNYYLIDGHCRGKSTLMCGKNYIDSFILFSKNSGDFNSDYVKVASLLGNVYIRNLPIIEV